MKYLIAGLGNMGPDYDHTRHNLGFDILDGLAERYEVKFSNDTLGDIARFKYKGRILVLLKPSTYVNRSGKAVRYWLQKEKIPVERLLVVIDDLNLPLGKLRLRGKGSDGGHNGLRDIDQHLGGNKYARLRVGIGSDFSQGRQVDYVLGEWTEEEAKALPEIIERAGDTITSFVSIGLQHTMNQFN